jgi:hypothetical protein
MIKEILIIIRFIIIIIVDYAWKHLGFRNTWKVSNVIVVVIIIIINNNNNIYIYPFYA